MKVIFRERKKNVYLVWERTQTEPQLSLINRIGSGEVSHHSVRAEAPLDSAEAGFSLSEYIMECEFQV